MIQITDCLILSLLPIHAEGATAVMIPTATDYATERARFCADAERLGAHLDRHVHPLGGPDGGELTTDVARFGPPAGDASTVLVITSGLHGVEGHAGSGLQHLLVESGRLGGLPASTAVVMVHSVNPYGHAWSRRVDHQNIDVNRNFLAEGEPPPVNALYGEVDHLLNPTGPTFDLDDTSFLTELGEWIGRVGAHEGFRAISGGQYSHPAGIQFGGLAPSWSRRTLESIWAQHLDGAARVVALDIHTGLGPCGVLTVFQTADEDEPAAGLGRAWFSDHLYRADRDPEESLDTGLMGPGLDRWVDGRMESAAFVVEFGTHDPTVGVTVFRADNWLHQHGDPRSEAALPIRAAVRDFFFVDDEGWRTQVAELGLHALHTALDGAAG